jgi:hypothetical protein
VNRPDWESPAFEGVYGPTLPDLTVDGRPWPLRVVNTELTFPAGAAGLRTARLVCS